jgi:hypothetical protein
MKRMTCFVMALALVLGLAQCKKEQLKPENEGEKVTITLDVKGDNNAKVDVDPPYVTFRTGDEIQVACDGHHVGTLTHDGTKFIGDLTNVTPGQPLYFYFFGNVSPQYFDTHKESCTVYIGEQTGDLPVISMGPSIDSDGNIVNYTSGVKAYSARLHNKCSLMKFNVDTPSTAPICITGMKNFVRVDFTNAANVGENNGFTYDMVYDGKIKMAGVTNGNTETWAIVLRQDPVDAGVAYTENGYIGTRPAIGAIESNQFYSAGVDMTLNSYNSLAIPLTFEARENGAKVSFSKVGSPNGVSLEISINDGAWMPYNVNSPQTITLANEGDKVMFRGTNTKFATNPSNYHKFSIENGGCYVYGNIMSLIDSTGYVTATSLGNNPYTFESLFADCTGICEHYMMTLELPATSLASYCYSYMFKGCTGLTVAPKLPASGLTEGCYQGMFQDCTGLEESPVLPAATLVSNCYSSMFSGCKNLNRITCLAEQGIDCLGSTGNWVSGAGTGEDVESPVFFKKSGVPNGSSGEEGKFWPSGDNGIPSGWSVENY